MIRDFIASLSLSNLCFIPSWSALIWTWSKDTSYFLKVNYAAAECAALMLNVLLLAVPLWFVLTISRRFANARYAKFINLFVVLILFVGLNNIWVMLAPSSIQGSRIIQLLIILSLLLVSIFVLVDRGRRLNKFAVKLLLFLSPLALVLFAQATWIALRASYQWASASKQLSAPLLNEAKRSSRILWMVFDEFDLRIAFNERPSELNLPELDRFRSQAIFASNAYPPARETMLSLPALTTGKLVSAAQPTGPHDLEITFGEESEPVRWSEQPNIFSMARAAGYNAALVGWYHPYCRVLGANLTDCSWEAYTGIMSENFRFTRRMFNHANEALAALPLMRPLKRLIGFGPYNSETRASAVKTKHHVVEYQKTLEEAKRLAINPELGLLLVHWPVPHAPFIFNQEEHRISVARGNNYLDNLALTDAALGELRREMESAGVWESTTILITSDHWKRRNRWKRRNQWHEEPESFLASEKDHRIPFILKTAGQNEAMIYDPGFNTVLTHDLFRALLRGELSGPESVMEWLDRHRSITDSPYQNNKYDEEY